MRHLYLTRGNVGSGKSTWLRDNGFEPYTLCADTIRLQIQAPILTVEGKRSIGQNNDRRVWELLFQMLENRMERGELVFIDATHSKSTDFASYKKLADAYRYRMFCIDFSDVPLETCKAQNLARDEYKHVPERALENIDARLKTQPIPGYVTRLTKETFWDVFQYRPLEFDKYKAIHIIGDVHGCMEPLNKFFDEVGYHDDHFYIFAGDYVDRGIQNAEVVKWLLANYDKPNFLFLEGNHERWLRFWANDEYPKIRSKEFLFQTAPELEKAGVDKKDVRQLCRKFAQLAYFKFDERIILVTHAGISCLPENLNMIATEQFIKGVGKYEDMEAVAASWAKHSWTNAIQFAGHRNVTSCGIKINEKYYNLEGKIEFGGHLRAVTLIPNQIIMHEYKNDIFRPSKVVVETELESPTLLQQLRSRKDIIERAQGDISSFNFSRDVFYDRTWNASNIKARGLFINTITNEIVARSYNKFFNIGEREETKIENLKFAYPVRAYNKENGYLGMVGYDNASDQLLFTSKSMLDGKFADMFKEIFAQCFDMSRLDELKLSLKTSNITLVFEVIDPIRDPHIIKYDKSTIILLDVVRRTIDYEKLPYADVQAIAKRFGFECKKLAFEFKTPTEFNEWYKQTQDDMSTTTVEGYVLEDSKGFMAKVKLPSYQFWKHMRSVKEALKHRRNVNLSALTNPTANFFYAWLKTLPPPELELDIIQLKEKYEQYRKQIPTEN